MAIKAGIEQTALSTRFRPPSGSVELKRRVAREYLAGETLQGLATRHDIARTLIGVRVERCEAGAFDADARAAALLQGYEARIAAQERLVGDQAMKREFLTGRCPPERRREAGLRPRSPARRPLARAGMPADGHRALCVLRRDAGRGSRRRAAVGPGPALRRPVQAEQDAAKAYRDLLDARGRSGSMGRRGNPHDNAKAASVMKMKTPKVEAVYPVACETLEKVAADLLRFVEEVSNRKRLRSALGCPSPVPFEEHQARRPVRTTA